MLITLRPLPMALKMEERQEARQPLADRKGPETDALLAPPEGMQPY